MVNEYVASVKRVGSCHIS